MAGFTARVMDLLEAVDSIHDTNETRTAGAIEDGSNEGEDVGAVGSVGTMVREYEKRTGLGKLDGGKMGQSGGSGRG